MAVGQLREINNAREVVGLDPIRQGKKNCLKCKKEFISADMKRIYYCINCKPRGENDF